MRISPRLLAGAALALAACDNPATAPAAPHGPNYQATVFANGSYREQQAIAGYIDCTGETLTGTGVYHATAIDVTNAKNGYNSGLHVQYDNVKLTGSAGSSFVGSSTFTQVINANVAGTVTADDRMVLVGQGRTPNYNGHVFYHYTVNANGEVTASIDRVVAECTGPAGTP